MHETRLMANLQCCENGSTILMHWLSWRKWLGLWKTCKASKCTCFYKGSSCILPCYMYICGVVLKALGFTHILPSEHIYFQYPPHRHHNLRPTSIWGCAYAAGLWSTHCTRIESLRCTTAIQARSNRNTGNLVGFFWLCGYRVSCMGVCTTASPSLQCLRWSVCLSSKGRNIF